MSCDEHFCWEISGCGWSSSDLQAWKQIADRLGGPAGEGWACLTDLPANQQKDAKAEEVVAEPLPCHVQAEAMRRGNDENVPPPHPNVLAPNKEGNAAEPTTPQSSVRPALRLRSSGNQPPPPDVPVLPKSHGPRRAQMVQKFLTQHMQCSGHDFFGHDSDQLQDVQQIFEDDPLLLSALNTPLKASTFRRRPSGMLREADKEAEQNKVDGCDLEQPDHSFQPMGIESFICRVQHGKRKRKVLATLRFEDAASSVMAKRLRRKEILRAEGLFRKIDYRGPSLDCDEMWEPEDEDGDAPIKCIPSF